LLTKAETDLEFVHHMQSQLNIEKEKLFKMQSGIIENDLSVYEKTKENVKILEDLVNPWRDQLLTESHFVFLPTCLGVLSRWPWYDFLKDWLCHMVKLVEEYNTEQETFSRFPFERLVRKNNLLE
jgi:hypothetical protein